MLRLESHTNKNNICLARCDNDANYKHIETLRFTIYELIRTAVICSIIFFRLFFMHYDYVLNEMEKNLTNYAVAYLSRYFTIEQKHNNLASCKKLFTI